jgi:hypothetical protein
MAPDPDAGYLIVLNFGSLAFCELLANLLTAAFGFRSSQGTDEPSVSKDAAAQFLLDTVKAFPNFSPDLVSRYAPFKVKLGSSNTGRDHYMASLGDALVNFVIAHEIAHFVRGHLSCGHLKAVPVGPTTADSVTVDAFHYEHSHEFEADVLGSAVLVLGAENSGSQFDAIVAMIATQVFLLALDLMEAVGGCQNSTHPRARERREHLMRELDYREDVLQVVAMYDAGLFCAAKTKLRER